MPFSHGDTFEMNINNPNPAQITKLFNVMIIYIYKHFLVLLNHNENSEVNIYYTNLLLNIPNRAH